MREPASLLSGTWTATVTAVAHAVDLEATARQFKALQRRRKIQTAEALLRLALIWAAGRQSFRQAAALVLLSLRSAQGASPSTTRRGAFPTGSAPPVTAKLI